MAWMILALAAAAPLQDRDPEAVRRQLREILGRSEFRQKMPSDFWANLRKHLDRNLKDREPDFDSDSGLCQIGSSGGALPGGLMNVLFILGCAILAAFLIVIGYQVWVRRNWSRPSPRTAPAAAPAGNAMPDPLARRSDEWADEADHLYRQGKLAEAIRALYLAALSHSHVRRWIDYHPSKPNWEHVRRFAGPGGAQSSLGSLTSVFERKWYGRKPADEVEYRSSRDLAAGILQAGESAT